MNRTQIVQTSDGEFTDVWLDGQYSRIPGVIISEQIAFNLVRNFRRKLMRCQ